MDSGAVEQQARAAYESAWTQRESGDLQGAMATTDVALAAIERALATNLDASRRRDLVELKSKITALRDAAHHAFEEKVAAGKDDKDKGEKVDKAEKGDKAEKADKADKSDKDKSDKNAKGDDKAGASDDGSADPKVLNAPAIEDLRPQVNADVHRYIEFFTGAGRSTFERWLKRSGRYMTLFRECLKREGLPPDLVHLVFVESGFNVHAKSVSAAVGPWQFLRSTGRLWGLTVNQWVDERRDPEKSTVAAARYLKHLYSIFGDWPLALASYNAGEGTVLRAIKRQGTTNYWDLRLPRQTEDYVPQFMACLAISREPKKYGFDDVDLDEPMAFDEVALNGAVDLRSLARMADCRYDELKLLNPAVLHHAASGNSGVTTIRVPRGKGEKLMQKLQSGAKLPAVDLTVRHRVRRRETLNSIAADYHVSARQLAIANGIGLKRPLRRGMILVVRATRSAPAIAQDRAAGADQGQVRRRGPHGPHRGSRRDPRRHRGSLWGERRGPATLEPAQDQLRASRYAAQAAYRRRERARRGARGRRHLFDGDGGTRVGGRELARCGRGECDERGGPGRCAQRRSRHRAARYFADGPDDGAGEARDHREARGHAPRDRP
ncbi:MAG: hypothetical protein E6K80_07785, partial [Candidatus Eisenbacteria bacterium]